MTGDQTELRAWFRAVNAQLTTITADLAALRMLVGVALVQTHPDLARLIEAYAVQVDRAVESVSQHPALAAEMVRASNIYQGKLLELLNKRGG